MVEFNEFMNQDSWRNKVNKDNNEKPVNNSSVSPTDCQTNTSEVEAKKKTTPLTQITELDESFEERRNSTARVS